MERRDLLLRRSAAYLIDIALAWVILALGGILVGGFLRLPAPETGPQVAMVILWNFSIPVWLYFFLADRSPSGATIGKRWMGLRVRSADGRQAGWEQALLRTFVKLLPWEFVHVTLFGLRTDLATFGPLQQVAVNVAWVATVAYFAVAVASRGRRSVHDYAGGTMVERDAGDAAG